MIVNKIIDSIQTVAYHCWDLFLNYSGRDDQFDFINYKKLISAEPGFRRITLNTCREQERAN